MGQHSQKITPNLVIQQHSSTTNQTQQLLATSNVVSNTNLQMNVGTSAIGSSSSSSLIKSLLANKVTPTNDSNTSAASTVATCLITPNVNVHQVTFLLITNSL